MPRTAEIAGVGFDRSRAQVALDRQVGEEFVELVFGRDVMGYRTSLLHGFPHSLPGRSHLSTLLARCILATKMFVGPTMIDKWHLRRTLLVSERASREDARHLRRTEDADCFVVRASRPHCRRDGRTTMPPVGDEWIVGQRPGCRAGGWVASTFICAICGFSGWVVPLSPLLLCSSAPLPGNDTSTASVYWLDGRRRHVSLESR